MKNRVKVILAAAILGCSPVSVAMAQDAGAPAPRRMTDYVINAPYVENWNVWGLASAPQPTAVEGAPGGQALRIATPRSGQPWDVGAVMSNPTAIQAGDVIFVAVWVRHAGGDAPGRLPRLVLEGQTASGDDAPKTTLALAEDAIVGDAWGMVYATGVAPVDFAAGRTSLILLLGREGQTLEVGPGLIYDLGPDFDGSTLPRNRTE